MTREVDYHTLSFMSGIAKKLKPKPPMTVGEWAERYMVLPSGSSVSGHYSADTVPYQRAIMDAITAPEVQEITVMSSAQVGKTLIIMCGIAYYIDYEPATQMFVMPTIADAERFSKTRFQRLCTSGKTSSSRRGQIPTGTRLQSGFTTKERFHSRSMRR